jgi:hypothetical protein
MISGARGPGGSVASKARSIAPSAARSAAAIDAAVSAAPAVFAAVAGVVAGCVAWPVAGCVAWCHGRRPSPGKSWWRHVNAPTGPVATMAAKSPSLSTPQGPGGAPRGHFRTKALMLRGVQVKGPLSETTSSPRSNRTARGRSDDRWRVQACRRQH